MQNTEAIWLINKDNHAALGKLNTLPRIGERLIYQTSGSIAQERMRSAYFQNLYRANIARFFIPSIGTRNHMFIRK